MKNQDAVYSEINRLDALLQSEKLHLSELRAADQLAVAAALSAAEKAVAAALVASEKAVNKAEVAQANINVNQNEFRGQLKDQASTLMPRNEAENTTRELRGLLVTLSGELSNMRSRIDIGPPSLGALQSESDARRGGSNMVSGIRADVVAAAAIASVIVAILTYTLK